MVWFGDDPSEGAQFHLNQAGRMTRGQRIHLLVRAALGAMVFLVPLSGMAYGFGRTDARAGLAFLLVGVIVALIVVAPSLLDVWQGVPATVSGRINRYTYQIRGPNVYYVEAAGLRLQTNGATWRKMNEGGTYCMYYGKHTKWILSFAVIEDV